MSTTESDHIDAVRDRLDTAFPDVPRLVIEGAVTAEHARFDGRTIRDFVPLLVERNARKLIRTTETNSLEDDATVAGAE